MGQSISGEFRRRRRLELLASGSRALTDSQRRVLREDAARLRASRQLRRTLFGPEMFGEAAWDILLILYVADGSEPSQGVSELSRSADAPLSTTVRWLAYLQEDELAKIVVRDIESNASRVELTSKGRRLLDDYFLELREAEGLAASVENPGNAFGG